MIFSIILLAFVIVATLAAFTLFARVAVEEQRKALAAAKSTGLESTMFRWEYAGAHIAEYTGNQVANGGVVMIVPDKGTNVQIEETLRSWREKPILRGPESGAQSYIVRSPGKLQPAR